MKKFIFAAALAVIGFNAIAQQTRESLAINENIQMAEAKFKSVDNKEVSLNDMKTSKGLIVMFSCNTCPYVIKSQERTKEVMAYAKSKDIGMVVVNSNEAQRDEADSRNAMSKYAKSQGYDVPYVIDEKSKLADAFGATRTPEVFLFNGEGKLVYKGAMEDNPSNPSESKEMFLKKAIDNMLSGKAVDPNSTKSIGCTIKRI